MPRVAGTYPVWPVNGWLCLQWQLGGSTAASVLLYRVATLFFQPGLACSQPMHGEVSDMVKCSVENAKRCSVSRNWKVMLEDRVQ